MIEYKIIGGVGAAYDMERWVQGMIEQGWLPLGAPFMAPNGFTQAMTRTTGIDLSKKATNG